ncbi:MAG: phosphoribosylformylglycinamidine synthase subunit PurS [Bacteroidetes bacterium]|jgi:phosphoribosylformylglycinamidine synthase PurS subunit|nr:phosphoribosylformylglycinamidine synthase subunit PurS [Bacteroidota bacterium]
MIFIAHIDIMPHDALLDPQGKAVEGGLAKLNLANLTQVRVGKHIRVQVEADNQEAASAAVDTACKQLLANTIMERFQYTLEPIS